MAKRKSAKLVFEISDDGSLKLLDGNLKKTKKSVDNLNRSEQTLNRNFKGASQQSSNQSKNFSKMAQGITGGLVPAYATLAANVFAIGAAFRFLQDAANYRILIEGQREYATVTGESLSLLTSRLRDATGGQLAFAEAAQSVAIGRAAGLSGDQLNRLGKVAKNASLALGRDLTDSFNRLVRGAVKAEPELLDELGIILRLETATKKYAQEIGKSAQSLNIFEKSQAVVNEVLEQGEDKFGEFNTQLNAFNKLAVSFDDLINNIKKGLSGVAEFIATALSKNVVALAGSFALLGSGILRAITPEAPQLNLGEARGKGLEGIQGMMNKEGRAKFGDLSSKQDIKNFERSLNAKESKFLNYEKFKRNEAKRTVAIIKAHNIELEIAEAGTFKRMGLRFKAELFGMQAEYGRFVGTMKFMSLQLSRVISAAGWIGLIASAAGIIAQYIGVIGGGSEESQKFADEQKRVAEQFRDTADEIKRIGDNLVMTDTIMTNFIKKAKLMANMDFTGGFTSFGTEPGDYKGFKNDNLASFTDNQLAIVQGTIGQLQQAAAGTSGKTQQGILDLIETLSNAVFVSGAGNVLKEFQGGPSAFAQTVKILEMLETKGVPGLDELIKLSNLPVLLKNTGEAFTKSLRDLRPNSTNLTNMTNSVKDMKEQLKGVLDVSTNPDFEKLFTGGEGDVFDQTTQGVLQGMIGDTRYEDIMKPFVDKKGVLLENLTISQKNAIIDEFQIALSERQVQLAQQEERIMNEKLRIETALLEKTLGMGKLSASQAKKEANILKVKEEIFAMEALIQQRTIAGQTIDDVMTENEKTKLDNLNTKLMIAEKEANLLAQVEMQFRDSFEQGMATAIQGLIEGTTNLKDAFLNMTKSILSAMAQVLAQQAAIAIMGSIPFFPGGGLGGRDGGVMKSPGYRSFGTGGVADGPDSGYTATLHGTEAVVPLPNGKSIPVEMSGGAGGNNISVNVNMTTGETSSEGSGEEAYALGRAISAAVQTELEKQQRPGGTLSPY